MLYVNYLIVDMKYVVTHKIVYFIHQFWLLLFSHYPISNITGIYS